MAKSTGELPGQMQFSFRPGGWKVHRMRLETLIRELRAARRLPRQWERAERMEALRPALLRETSERLAVIRRRLRVPRTESVSSWVVSGV